MQEINSLLNFDKKHIWHPYTSMLNPLQVYMVTSANGCEIELEGGQKLIDGMSSWWAVIHGYNNEKLNAAIQNQLKKMAHVMFGGLTHKPAIKLAQKLIEITPPKLQHVFFSDSGSVSVEVAMKMALQYWHAKGENSKTEFAVVKNSYHGDTWHAMSVCDPITGMHSIYNKKLPKQNFVNRPMSSFNDKWNPDDLKQMEELFIHKKKKIAAIIIEPIVQGAGGMYFYNPRYLSELRKLCLKHNILLILDEIATGFGRTGELFACNHANVQPDILCLGKAITGGYMSFAATLCSNDIAMEISNNSPGILMHGPTFMANPLACSVANTSIDLLLSQNWKSKIKSIETHLKDGLEPAKQISCVEDVRVLGAIGVIELKNKVNIEKMQAQFVKKGVWIRPFGRLVYTMPPFIIDGVALNKITTTMVDVIKNC